MSTEQKDEMEEHDIPMNTNSTGATGAVMLLNAPFSLAVEAMTQKLFKTSSMSLLIFSDGGSVRDSHG